jgi:hypothetical protein
MPRATLPSRRRLTVLGLGLGAAAAAVAAGPAHATAKSRPALVGTYQRMNKDLVEPDGTLRDVYADLLQAGGRTYRLHLPKNATRPRGGTPVRVTGTLAGADVTATEIQAVGDASTVATTGTTKALVILAYWTSPDSVTTTQAKSQVFGDDNGWFKEASYGQLGLTGTATPWVHITGPTGGLCYTNHMQILDQATAAAKTAGYDAALYDRTIVYFPRCSGGDSAGVAGWAYEPGTQVWLNGFMDRRVSVHEQGHNYGLEHAHTYTCTVSGIRVTLGGSCGQSEYGDDFDAMGGSNYVAHYSASQKDQLGWLAGRKRTLTATSTTFTLPPYETVATAPVAAVAGTTVATRKYWMEYRQALGYDATLPAGATGGVLVHMRDTAIALGPFLLDGAPQDGWSNAVIPPGGAWTSPEGVRISVGTVDATGAQVTVDGNAQPPTPPTVPRSLVAVGGDESAHLTWAAPLSNGGATVQSYTVTSTPPLSLDPVDGAETSLTVPFLTNGTTYTFHVAAVNAAGSSATVDAAATPTAQLPSVALTAPAGGAEVSGVVPLTATATPNAVSNQAITGVEFSVDGESIGYADGAPYAYDWDIQNTADGEHTLTATAYDAGGRYATSAGVVVTVKTPRPTVAITSPADGLSTSLDALTLQSTTAPASGSAAAVQYVQYEVDGTPVAYASDGPTWDAPWDVAALSGTHTVVARVYDADSRSGESAPVHVTFDHPVPTVSLTAPADGASVSGSAVTVSAAPAAVPGGADVAHVDFYLDGGTPLGSAFGAPWETTWDTSGLAGPHVLTAVVADTAGHTGTSAPVTVSVDNPVPAATVTAPADRATVPAGAVPLTATATPNAGSGSAIAHVTFEVDGAPAADVPAPGPYTTSWDGTGLYGLHTVVAVAYDAAGQQGRSAPVTFTVAAPAPTAVLSAPSDGATVHSGTLHLAVAAAPDPGTSTKVTYADFYVDGGWVGFDYQPDGATSFGYDWTADRGPHVVSAIVYDDAFFQGNAAPVAITVADLPGAPGAVSATAGGNGTAAVSWTAPADDGGSPVTGYVVRGSDGAESPLTAGSPYVATGLANGTAYSFRVRARTAAGDGPLSAASAAVVPGTKTSLSISASASTVTYPGSVTVTGTLKRTDTGAVLGARTVQLLRCTHGTLTCTVAKTGTTSSTGVAKIVYALPFSRDLRLRWVTSGQFLGVTSAAKYVQVRVLVTSAVTKTSMPLGSSATVYGSVKPAHPGKNVYLQRYYGGAWHNVVAKPQSTTGGVSFVVKPTLRGTYYYRLSFPGDTDHLGGYSPSRSVKVT